MVCSGSCSRRARAFMQPMEDVMNISCIHIVPRSIPRAATWGLAGSLVLGMIGEFGIGRAVAVPMDPGAPLDGINRTIFMTENDQETLGTLSFQRLSDPAPIPIQPNAQ